MFFGWGAVLGRESGPHPKFAKGEFRPPPQGEVK